MDRNESEREFSGTPEALRPEPDAPPEAHPLRALFRSATRRAFTHFAALHDPAIEDHIVDEVLADFVHTDRLYRLRDREGRRLTDLVEMALEERRTDSRSGLERDLEVHQHLGNFALFMAGLFPEFIERRGASPSQPLLAYVGSAVIAMSQPKDYYIVEGRTAYSHVSRLYRALDSGKSSVFHRLSSRFEEYLDVMTGIRDVLREEPDLDRDGGIIV